MTGDWLDLTVADVADVIGGGTPSTKDPTNFDGDVPWLTPKDLSGTHERYVERGSRNISRKGLASSSARLLPTRAVLLSTRAPIGYVALARNPVSTNQGFRSLIVRDDHDPEFIYYWLRSNIEELERHSSGSTFKELSGSALKAIRIQLPARKSEQTAVAAILAALDDKIELNRRMAQTLEEMARALFKSWFVDFDPVRAKAEGRDPGLPKHLADLFPDRLVDSDLGEIPKGWESVQLGEHVRCVKGRSYRSSELVDTASTAMVTLKSFERGGGYRADGLKPFKGAYKPEQVVLPGELVIACTDVTQAAEVVGRPAIVRSSETASTLVASLDSMVVRPASDRVSTAFLYYLAMSENFASHMYAHASGTTVLHLAKEAVPSFEFPLPPHELLLTFDVLAGSALEQINILFSEISTLARLRDALLPKLVSGDVRLPDPEGLLARLGAVS